MKKWYAVIGDPIEQSKSPIMHDKWFVENEIDATYIPLHVRSCNLGDTVENLRNLGCSGWNVTIPHKSAIIPYLDALEPSATIMNAVNTVRVKEDGTLIGANTDGEGFVNALTEVFNDIEFKAKKILVIGAGGAARGIVYALRNAGNESITVANRTKHKAQRLVETVDNATAISLHEAQSNLTKYEVIIQTTDVGMMHGQAGMPIELDQLVAGTIVCDIIYNPLETEFLKEAKRKGALTMSGVDMFVHQGALSFFKWTSISPNTVTMKKTIRSLLGG